MSKKGILKTALCMFVMICTLLICAKGQTALADDALALKGVTLYVGEQRNFDNLLGDRVRYSAYGDNEDIFPYKWELTSDNETKYKAQKYIKLSGDEYNKYLYIKALKAGSFTLVFTQRTEPDEDLGIESRTYTVSLKVTVKSPSSINKKAAAAAQKIMKKKSSKATFIFKDITMDGIKDLVTDGKIYFYNTKTKKMVAYSQLGKRKILEVYANSKKKSVILKCQGTTTKSSVKSDENKKYVKNSLIDYDVDTKPFLENKMYPLPVLSYYNTMLTSAGKTLYKTSKSYAIFSEDLSIDEEGSETFNGYVYDKAISKTEYNKPLSGAKKVPAYKNTSKNRKKYIK